MKKFEEKFLNVLVKRYGFYIKDYFSSYKNESKWIAVSENDRFAYCVIVCDENEANQCYYEAGEALKTMITKPIVLNVIIAAKNKDVRIESFGQYNKIIYSLSENRVVYSHEGCKPLIQVLDYINHKEETKKNRFRDYKVTYTLIALNIVIFILSAIFSKNILSIDTYVLINTGAKVNELINHGQVWRLLTCAFLHGGIMHIAFNMYALKIIGSEVEYAYGRKKYLIIYFISALGGSAFSYIFSPYSISVGASGAIFGLLGAMLVFGYKNKERIGKGYMMNIIQVLVINILIGVTLSNIDNFAHLGGAIAGAATSLLTKSRVSDNN